MLPYSSLREMRLVEKSRNYNVVFGLVSEQKQGLSHENDLDHECTDHFLTITFKAKHFHGFVKIFVDLHGFVIFFQ